MNNLNSKLIELFGEIMFSVLLCFVKYMILCLLFSFSLCVVTILLAIRDINEVLNLENKIRKKAVSTQREL